MAEQCALTRLQLHRHSHMQHVLCGEQGPALMTQSC
jgi:hypothetical protein